MSKYLVLFAIGYAATIGLCALLARIVPIGSFGSVVALIGGAFVAMGWFLSDRQRRPTRQEMTVLVAGSLVASLLVSAVMVSLFLWVFSEPEQTAFMLDALRATSLMIWALGLLVVCAVSLLLLYLSYAGYAKMWARRRTAAA
ncbi:hypothetical protein B1810_23960 [Panacagrimonas perspica]|uniref:ABZJ_00895 family protein n=1 Tax=Panacagrimonas perspica TaxID=381431 RepID=UPI00105D23FD|nr:ABZJ_00895 family protein [Panacagrimonas perspica]THD00661.1 hypothetical protein B1810_23960 [Panacagrimonas perspica]